MNLHYNSSVGSGVELQSTESDQKVILMNFLPQKRELKKANEQIRGINLETFSTVRFPEDNHLIWCI